MFDGMMDGDSMVGEKLRAKVAEYERRIAELEQELDQARRTAAELNRSQTAGLSEECTLSLTGVVEYQTFSLLRTMSWDHHPQPCRCEACLFMLSTDIVVDTYC